MLNYGMLCERNCLLNITASMHVWVTAKASFMLTDAAFLWRRAIV